MVRVKIERYKNYSDLVVVTSRDSEAPATDKIIVRALKYELLDGSHVPEQFWHRLGALVALLLRDQNVIDVEIWTTDGDAWIADALVAFGDARRMRRGEGDTPVEAFVNLIWDIQRY